MKILSLRKNAAPVLVMIGLLLVWEILARLSWIPVLLFPPPSRIISYLITSLQTGELASVLGITLLRLGAGLLLGCGCGLLLGWAIGFSPRLQILTEPFIAALHPLPKVAIFPFILFIFGIGELSKVIAVAITAFFPVLINTVVGVKHISPVYRDVARNYGASRWNTFRTVILPGGLPWTLTGIRIAANTSFTVVIAVELLAAQSGLGVMIWFGWETLNILKLYVALIAISLVGILINSLFHFLSARYTPWTQTFANDDERAS